MATNKWTEKLAEPFSAKQIKWRVGSTTQSKENGMALPYIDARAVMDRLDEVVGPESWQDSYVVHDGLSICTLKIQPPSAGDAPWIAKSDGAGQTSYEGEKGGISDAFKRAAVKWGIGRFLYDMDSPWVAVDAVGNPNKPSYRIARSAQQELNAIANKLPGTKIKDTEPEGSPAPPKKGAAKKKAATKKPEPESGNRDGSGTDPGGSGPEPGQNPPGVVLLALMRVRCIELGVDDKQAGQILNEIILVDLALEKNSQTLTAEMATIKAKVLEWTPNG